MVRNSAVTWDRRRRGCVRRCRAPGADSDAGGGAGEERLARLERCVVAGREHRVEVERWRCVPVAAQHRVGGSDRCVIGTSRIDEIEQRVGVVRVDAEQVGDTGEKATRAPLPGDEDDLIAAQVGQHQGRLQVRPAARREAPIGKLEGTGQARLCRGVGERLAPGHLAEGGKARGLEVFEATGVGGDVSQIHGVPEVAEADIVERDVPGDGLASEVLAAGAVPRGGGIVL
jgi:hypothetical protein